MRPDPFPRRSWFAAWVGAVVTGLPAMVADLVTFSGLCIIAMGVAVFGVFRAWLRPSINQIHAKQALDGKERVIQNLTRVMEGKR